MKREERKRNKNRKNVCRSLRRKGTSYKGFFLFICFVWGGMMIWFSLHTILSRALIEVDGTIIKTRKEPYFPDDRQWAHLRETRYACIYIIEPSSGGDNIQYIAHQNDPTLAQDLPVGTKIEKEKWEITYKVDDEIVEDFNLRHYIIIGCIGFFLVTAGLIRLGYYFIFH